MKRIVVFGTGIGLALAAAATAVAADKPKVEAVGAEELRTAGENGTGSSSAQEPRLTVVLRIDGLDQPARFGRVVVTEAKDDAGTDLRPKDDDAEKEGDQKLTELPNVTRPVGSSTVEDVPKAFYVRVRLRPSARQARRIASLKGEIRVAAGGGAEKPAVITIPGVKALRGKTVDNPELARAGVTVQVGRQGPQDDLELGVMVSGELPRDCGVSVVGADGKNMVGVGGGTIGKNNIQNLIRLKRPLLDSDALRITLPLARNKVTVPFELKEVQLP